MSTPRNYAPLVSQYRIPTGDFHTLRATAVERVLAAADFVGYRRQRNANGKGDLADAITDACPEVALRVMEPHSRLREILKLKGYDFAPHDNGQDFLQHPRGAFFDRVVMNPPFEDGQDIAHVRHAFDVLKPDGVLVAVMSECPFFHSTKRAEEFRAWLDEVGGEATKNEPGAFDGEDAFRRTGVHTRTVIIRK